MIVKKAEFLISTVKPDQWPVDDTFEVAFSGKSNVGKSSLINALTNRKKLAYSGSTPGKTRMINFYNINDTIRFADLPGYGFSKASKSEREAYSKLAQQYMSQRENLKLVIQLLDIRHDATSDDIMMIDFLNQTGIPYAIVATKCDKLSTSKSYDSARKLVASLDIDPDTPFILASAETKKGIDEIWHAIDFYCDLSQSEDI